MITPVTVRGHKLTQTPRKNLARETAPREPQRIPSRVKDRPRRHKQLRPTAGAPREPAHTDTSRIAQRRFGLIEPILDLEPGTPEWRHAISIAARSGACSRKTIRRWLRQYRDWGMIGLMRQFPAGCRGPRVVVSRTFDGAFREAGHDEAILRKLGALVEQSLAGQWAGTGAFAGWAEIKRLAEFVLLEAVENLGLTIPVAKVRLSRRKVEAFRRYSVVNTYRNDRKAYYDGEPRIARDFTGLAPMELVCADAKYCDNLVWHWDDDSAWPKAIVFVDLGTNRAFVVFFLLPRNKGVSQEHVIEAFLQMANHPEWGLPQGLYLDNGPEFGGLDKFQRALNRIVSSDRQTIVRALPRNPAAKPAEGVIARLDRYVLSQIPGYAGGDRAKKKTQVLGKAPEPFPGSWEEFCDLAQTLVASYNMRPVGGLWKGRSPDDWFAAKVEGGWSRTAAEPDELDAAFGDEASGRVDRGVIKFKNRRFYSPYMDHDHRAKVALRVPWRRGLAPLFQDASGVWRRLATDEPFIGNSIEGAKEGAVRRTRARAGVRNKAREVRAIDPAIRDSIQIAARMVARRPPTEVPTIATTIDLGHEVRSVAGGAQAGVPNMRPKDVWAERRASSDRLARAFGVDRKGRRS
jgi:hypothetical protein